MNHIGWYFLVFLYGIIIGSFLNVCIYRIPEKSSIVTGRSSCMKCGTQIKWFDLIPIISFIFLRGKCRNCKSKISVQYPMIEALNGILYVMIFTFLKFSDITSLLLNITYCFLISALIVLSVIDYRTKMIPFGINVVIFILGILALIIDKNNWINHIIGFFAVSLFLYLIFLITKGRGIGGGDIKLMAAAGLLVGWKLILLAFFLGCVYGAVIHLIRMKLNGAGRELAFGPYLSAGIVTSVLFGKQLISWYFDTYLF